MAGTGQENLKQALTGAVSATTGAVKGTLEIANAAVSKATTVTKSAVNAAGVLGDETVKASETIGKAAVAAGVDVSTTALAQGAEVTAEGIKASATIANAATQATADIAVTALDTTASTVTTTTDQVGKALNAGVTLAGNTVTNTFKGLDNIGKLVAGRGSLEVQSTLQKQGATAQGIAARESKDVKERLLKTFDEVKKQMMSALSTLHGVQKTALVGRINIYKRAKCGFFRRLAGACDAGTISNDMKATDLFLNDFKTTLETASQQAKTAIAAAPEANLEAYHAIETTFNTTCANAVNKFVTSYKGLLDKYDTLTRKALGMAGGRRRTRRMRRRPTTRRSKRRI